MAPAGKLPEYPPGLQKPLYQAGARSQEKLSDSKEGRVGIQRDGPERELEGKTGWKCRELSPS